MINIKSIKDYKKHLTKKTILLFIARAIMAYGFFAFIVFGFIIPAISKSDVTKKYDKEYKISGFTAIALDDKKNLYCYMEHIEKVNVYDTEGIFQYSLTLPFHNNGGGAMVMKDNKIYILAKSGEVVYEYEYGELLSQKYLENSVAQKELEAKDENISAFDKEGNEYYLIGNSINRKDNMSGNKEKIIHQGLLWQLTFFNNGMIMFFIGGIMEFIVKNCIEKDEEKRLRKQLENL